MKKGLLVLGIVLCTTLSVSAEIVDIETNITKDNFWQKNGVKEEKVLEIGHKILNDNHINRRIPIVMNTNNKVINADSSPFYKTVTIYYGILPYIDNDDELAYVLSHEIAHSREAYNGGAMKIASMRINSKKYETDADITAIDMMVKSGYNPVAAITMANKILEEPASDWGFWRKHPKGSKRIMAMYSYIYKKYPQYLTSPMTKNINYENFEYSMNKDIKGFEQKEKRREARDNGDI